MLTNLFQRINNYVKDPKINPFYVADRLKPSTPPPDLTNEDLEFLFTQLLEGVQQGQGEQWVQMFLKRMADRISVERWMDWLFIFGEKLLLSQEDHRELAALMIQLGKLEIGKVGELAENIGISLINKSSGLVPSKSAADLSSPGLDYTFEQLWTTWDEDNKAQDLTGQGNNTENDISVEAQKWFYQGLELAKGGDLTGALAAYEHAIALKPDSYQYWFSSGLTLFHLQRFSEAIAAYDQAIALKPNDYKSWHNRGATLGELGDMAAAIGAFNQAIAIQPHNPKALSSKAFALLKSGHIGEAISTYDQVLSLNPEDKDNWYHRGMALAVAQKYPEAMASYDRALAIDPEAHEVWVDRGVLLFNLGNWQEAINSWEESLSRQPNFYLAWYNRGIALENLGKSEEALESYRRAVDTNPEFYYAWYNQAVTLFYLGRFTEAISCYDHTLNLEPKHWQAWMARGTAIAHIVNPPPEWNSLSTDSENKLYQVGQEGQLASYQEGLKHISAHTHPEGWGRLHLEIGNVYYIVGKKNHKHNQHWHQAVQEYKQALSTLTVKDFPSLYLEVSQSLITVLISLKEFTEAKQVHKQAGSLLVELLTNPHFDYKGKQLLALQFAGIGQLTVDLAIQEGELAQAWQIAEHNKNYCLSWQMSHCYQNASPTYNSIQPLLNPHTAIVYWHISPVSLHTFIIKHQAPAPLLVSLPIQEISTTDEPPLPEAVRRLVKFEDWLRDWYQVYPAIHNHDSHHGDMESSLWQLRDILDIPTVIEELEGITHLILIPHQNLQSLPLHALFHLTSPSEKPLPNNLTISYLPNVHMGLSMGGYVIGELANQKLVSVEYPSDSDGGAVNFSNVAWQIMSGIFPDCQRNQRDDATKKAVLDILSDHSANILHFTGNILNNYAKPYETALSLANQEQLTLSEISQSSIVNLQLVTLAASQNSLTYHSSLIGEHLDLVTIFLCRGVPLVVNTLWSVESPARDLVLIEFYKQIALKQTPVAALASATAWLRKITAGELKHWYEELLNNLNTEDLTTRAVVVDYLYQTTRIEPYQQLYKHPYYWAAFTITAVSDKC